MNPLLEAIAQGWGWKLGEPVAIIATNRFGNALVRNKAGQFFRITPEELQCELLAQSSSELEEKRSRGDCVRDWEMAALVERAESALGPLAEGEVYYLVVPGCLGGQYSEETSGKSRYASCSRIQVTWRDRLMMCPTEAASLSELQNEMVNKAAAVNAPIAPWFQFGQPWRRVTEPRRWTLGLAT